MGSDVSRERKRESESEQRQSESESADVDDDQGTDPTIQRQIDIGVESADGTGIHRSSPASTSTDTDASGQRGTEYVEYHTGPDREALGSQYRVDFVREGQARRLQRLESEHGSAPVQRWAEEGMTIETMGKPRDMAAFRERKEGRSEEIPADVERRNQASAQRSVARAQNDGQAGQAGVPDIVRSVISSPGTSMDETVQREMESNVGGDFNDVQLHTGPQAAAAADSINARAFTVGNHVAFNRGEYNPESTDGKGVLAHELTHVRQQTEGTVSMLPKPGFDHPGAQDGEAAFSGTTVQRLGTEMHVQPKLKVSSPDDPAEKEAEKVAERVVEMDASANRQEDGEPAQRESTDVVTPSESATAASGGNVSDGAESRVRSGVQGSGKSLPSDTRSEFESKMGADFSDVSVHTGPEADAAARSISAEAYTMGSDIAFADGAYEPGSNSGKELLAHELTHTIQQNPTNSVGAEVNTVPSSVLKSDAEGENQESDREQPVTRIQVEVPNTADEYVDWMMETEGPPVYPLEVDRFQIFDEEGNLSNSPEFRQMIRDFHSEYMIWAGLAGPFMQAVFRLRFEHGEVDLEQYDSILAGIRQWFEEEEDGKFNQAWQGGGVHSFDSPQDQADDLESDLNDLEPVRRTLDIAEQELENLLLELEEIPEAEGDISEIEGIIEDLDRGVELSTTLISAAAGGPQKLLETAGEEAWDSFSLGEWAMKDELESHQAYLSDLQEELDNNRIEVAQNKIQNAVTELEGLEIDLENDVGGLVRVVEGYREYWRSLGEEIEREAGVEGVENLFRFSAALQEVAVYAEPMLSEADDSMIEGAERFLSMWQNGRIVADMAGGNPQSLDQASMTKDIMNHRAREMFEFFYVTAVQREAYIRNTIEMNEEIHQDIEEALGPDRDAIIRMWTRTNG